jgi:hypothetical protein
LSHYVGNVCSWKSVIDGVMLDTCAESAVIVGRNGRHASGHRNSFLKKEIVFLYVTYMSFVCILV